MRIIGLTGGIGSGKTTVSALLKEAGEVVIEIDEVSKKVAKPGTRSYRNIVQAFGQDILFSSGEIDYRKLSKIVFEDRVLRRRLYNATNKYIYLDVIRTLLYHFLKGTRVVFIDAPLLFETNAHIFCSHVVCVFVAPHLQLERIRNRGDLTDEQAEARLKLQLDPELKAAQSHHVFLNNGPVADLRAQVKGYLRNLRHFHLADLFCAASVCIATTWFLYYLLG